jgi:hypothetical protein
MRSGRQQQVPFHVSVTGHVSATGHVSVAGWNEKGVDVRTLIWNK